MVLQPARLLVPCSPQKASRTGEMNRSMAFTDFESDSQISWAHEDEFDKKAASNVISLFSELDDLLYADTSLQRALSDSTIVRECKEWRSR